jgi:hypothetical protein
MTTRVSCNSPACNLGEVLDLSATGARVRCRRFLKPAAGGRTPFVVAAGDGREIRLDAAVCWVRRGADRWEVGLAFDMLTPEEAFALASFAEQHRLRGSLADSA